MKVAIVLNSPNSKITVQEDYVICADAGYDLLKNRKPDLLVGDFDSMKNRIQQGIEVMTLPVIKDYTDGEFAVQKALEMSDTEEIVFYGLTGGRTDHVLGNIGLLKTVWDNGIKVKARAEGLEILLEGNTEVNLATRINRVVSVIPVFDKITLSDSEGLFYDYNNLELDVFSSRGISNVAMADKVKFKIAGGPALIFNYLE